MDFDKFIETYREQAMGADLAARGIEVVRILARAKRDAMHAANSSERAEVLQFINKQIKTARSAIYTAIDNKHYLQNYVGSLPPFIYDVRLFIEYSDLRKSLEPRKKSSLSLRAIALKHVLNEESIDSSNQNEIAELYGHTSGKKLREHYNYYMSRQNRIGNPESAAKLKNIIKLFEQAIPLLSPENKGKAEAELATIKSYL